jgi:hypothetical protein
MLTVLQEARTVGKLGESTTGEMNNQKRVNKARKESKEL